MQPAGEEGQRVPPSPAPEQARQRERGDDRPEISRELPGIRVVHVPEDLRRETGEEAVE